MSGPVVELQDIIKVFPGVRANDGVSFTIEAGEVHGLLGENGAGKSTLVSILYGLYQPDGGRILVRGEPREIASPRDALGLGIAIVQQHFALVPTLTVAENVVLGSEHGLLRRPKQLQARVRELCQRHRVDLDPAAKVGGLSVGERQRVEILKCLYREPSVVIFDEPTTVLTPPEVASLFATLRSLAAAGTGIVLITHKLDELLEVADRITVLRAGREVATVDAADVDPGALARLMVGRDVRLRTVAAFVGLDTDPSVADAATTDAPTTDAPTTDRVVADGAPSLQLEGITVAEHGVTRLDAVSLEVRPGEVVGIAGVEGNGQRELVEVLCGTRRPTAGTVRVGGGDLTTAGPVGYRRAGVRAITEDRHATGSVLDMTVAENLVCDRIGEAPLSTMGVLRKAPIQQAATALMEAYRVRAPGPATLMRSLSGGNQQRAILARELSQDVRVLVAAQPTRGLDVGAIEEVTDRILAVRDAGAAVLLISSDLAEVLSLSDRVAVLHRGRLVATLDRADANPDVLGPLMAGLGAPAVDIDAPEPS